MWDVNLDNHEIYVDPALRRVLGDDRRPTGATCTIAARVGARHAAGSRVIAAGETASTRRGTALHATAACAALARGSLVPRDFAAVSPARSRTLTKCWSVRAEMRTSRASLTAG
jgi:hypothetical protein